MGYKVNRVPLDFAWPLGEVWPGYLVGTYPFEVMLGHAHGSDLAPPSGDGWQMWETCSEGSPISPVLESPEELAEWLAECRAETATYDQWLAMIHRRS